MDELQRAVSYAFDDPQGITKLVIAAMIAAASVVFTPLMIGLVGWAIIAGYLVELVRRARGGEQYPLPHWDHIDTKLADGGNVLVALILYGLPNALLGCCVIASSGFSEDNFGVLLLPVFCCLVPLLLIYNIVLGPVLALGLVRYSETGQIGAFFQVGDILSTLRASFQITATWYVMDIIASTLIGMLGLIPCIGWLAMVPLMISVRGYLLAKFGDKVEGGKHKGKPKYVYY